MEPQLDVEVTPGVDQRGCGQQEDEDDSCDDGGCVAGPSWVGKKKTVVIKLPQQLQTQLLAECSRN